MGAWITAPARNGIGVKATTSNTPQPTVASKETGSFWKWNAVEKEEGEEGLLQASRLELRVPIDKTKMGGDKGLSDSGSMQ